MPKLYDEKYTDYQTNRGLLRSLVRHLYVAKASNLTGGVVLDFGCGVGDLLSRLPSKSLGLEYNESTIKIASGRGLDVLFYDGFADNWSLSVVPFGRKFDTLVLSHVLEHFENPFDILSKLIRSSIKLGVKNVLIIVPGRAGYEIDPTHRYFVTRNDLVDFFASEDLYKIKRSKYFPFNSEFVSNFFAHNEFQFLIELTGD